MPRRFHASLARLALFALPLGGCGPRIVYDYAPPESPEGRLCAAQCANTQSFCRQSAEVSYRACQSSFQAALGSYNACRDANGKGCVYPPACFFPNTSGCDESYRACYVTCGGRVRARPVE